MANDDFTRRELLKVVGLGTLGFALSSSINARALLSAPTRELLLYVGTYTTGKSEGIYIYRMNLSSGELKPVHIVKGIINPSYLEIDRRRRYLYAVNEVTEFNNQPGGAVSAFSINQQTGDLRFLNQQPSRGGAPCYVSAAKNGKFVLVANYVGGDVGGNVSVLPIQPDGRLGVATDTVQHRGSGANPQRQERPHAHCVVLDAANRFAFAADLGADKIFSYRFDANQGNLMPNAPPSFQTKPGAGPRHFTFHANGKFAYVINELDSTVTALAYDSANGTLREMQTVSALPADFSGTSYCADVHISPSGKFLYGSNRGHNSIVVFGIDERDGRLKYIEHVSTDGKYPRNFTIDPTGAFLLAANQNSDTIVTFRIDSATGKLRPTNHITEVPSPVCLKLLPTFVA